MANEDIKVLILRSNLKQYQIAQKIGMADSNFSHLLRNELSPERRVQVMKAIDDLLGRKENEDEPN